MEMLLRRPAGVLVAAVVAACSGGAPPPPKPPASTTTAEADPVDDSMPSVSTRGWLGVEVATPAAGDPGVLVRGVIRGSPAERAGIASGDRILFLDGQSVTTPEDVVRLVSAHGSGSRVGIVIARGGARRLFAAELGAAPDDTGVARMSYVGMPAPALVSLETIQGSLDPTLTGLRGKVVVLEFWATWCPVCRFLVPTLNDWHARYSAQGVALLGITMETLESASQTAQQLGMRYPLASDDSGKTTLAYRANALPAIFVLDRKGIVRDVAIGYSSGRMREIESLIEKLAAEP